MKKILIGQKKDGQVTMPYDRSPLAVALLKAVLTVEEEPVKLYSTDVVLSEKGPQYTFVTGSKEIHLKLGLMGYAGRKALAELIAAESMPDGLLIVSKGDGSVKGGLICQMGNVIPGVVISITLSHANV